MICTIQLFNIVNILSTYDLFGIKFIYFCISPHHNCNSWHILVPQLYTYISSVPNVCKHKDLVDQLVILAGQLRWVLTYQNFNLGLRKIVMWLLRFFAWFLSILGRLYLTNCKSLINLKLKKHHFEKIAI